MNENSNNNKTADFGNTLLCEVAYEKCQLVAKKEQVYTADGKYMFSVSMTDRAKALLDNDGWEKGKESWLDYRQRTNLARMGGKRFRIHTNGYGCNGRVPTTLS